MVRRPSGCVVLLVLVLVLILVRFAAGAATGVPPSEMVRPCPGDTNALSSRSYLGRCPQHAPPAVTSTTGDRQDAGGVR